MTRFAILCLVAAVVTAGAQAQPGAVKPGTAVQTGFRAPVLYVDVRTPREFAGGHVAGAINIPVEQLDVRWQELLPAKHRPLVLYCRSGRRSGLALDMLVRKGFSQATNGGGLEQLARSGLPTAR